MMYGDMADDKSNQKIRTQIDANLKRVYDDLVQEAVPDRFRELLDQLRNAEKPKGKRDD